MTIKIGGIDVVGGQRQQTVAHARTQGNQPVGLGAGAALGDNSRVGLVKKDENTCSDFTINNNDVGMNEIYVL